MGPSTVGQPVRLRMDAPDRGAGVQIPRSSMRVYPGVAAGLDVVAFTTADGAAWLGFTAPRPLQSGSAARSPCPTAWRQRPCPPAVWTSCIRATARAARRWTGVFVFCLGRADALRPCRRDGAASSRCRVSLLTPAAARRFPGRVGSQRGR
ncbi:hypothetical protein ACTIVE_1698 [Actinomadura verrucosospora]|uniref:Uncharacterized protein n=1 Tax=Actinomadura verrucosospora TaxID=46165 RepID=A0A7D3ZJU2_ACTVE|nr:hypothetical protein ACTIVE_1698 [Actinomadura verrucosospora]